MDDDSECDWSPPDGVKIVESELLQIPSALPSLDEFIRTELEKEAAIDRVSSTTEAEVDAPVEDDVIPEVFPKEDSTVEGPDDDGAGEELQSKDDFDMQQAEVRKPIKTAKKSIDVSHAIETVKIDFGHIKHTVEDQAKEELKLYLIDSTHDFVENLIDKVVEKCEYEDPDEILRRQLSKTKVCRELDDKIFQLDIEQKIRFFLNRKTVEYFRRKKTTRPLVDDSPDQIINELRKYRDNLQMVSDNKDREVAIKSSIQTEVADLKNRLEELRSQAMERSEEFANLVKKIFALDGSEKMITLIDYLMNKVNRMREEISKVRFVLIWRQHTMDTLLDKADKLEDLGNGLRMVDFEHLQTETQALGKKIEERNNELNRLHARCNADIHTLAHVREKQYMIRNTIAAQQDAYNELVEEKQNCREYLNSLKLNRGFIRREIQRISFQGGLLDKPELLLDYDVTVEKTDTLRAKINDMKAEQLIVENKLTHMMELLQ